MIRILKQEELPNAMHLVWDVFFACTAPHYSSQGVEEFKNFIKIEHIGELYAQKQMFFWGAFENNELMGVSAMHISGHISLFNVRQIYQNQEIERGLFQAMKQFCAHDLGIMRIIVHAAPNEVVQYQRLGFQTSASQREQNGVRYVPMEYIINSADIEVQNKKYHVGLAAGIIVASVIAGIFIIAILSKSAVEVVSNYANKSIGTGDERNKDWSNNSSDDMYSDEGKDYNSSEEDDFNSIPVYEAVQLSYSIEEKEYYKEESSGGVKVFMDIQYPQLNGLEGEKTDEINKILEDCAMEVAEQLYLNPSKEVLAFIEEQDYPYLESRVRYNITYMSEDVISVVFEDDYLFGSIFAEYHDLRTKTINLKNGTVYEIKDIVNTNDAFMKTWYDIMKENEPGAEVIDLVPLEVFKQVLEGEFVENRYMNAFYLREGGIDIGLSYHYGSETLLARGWITAPFTFNEILEYKSDSDLWSYIK